MRASAHVEAVAAPGGRTRVARLRSQPPLVLRETIDGLTLVSAAGGPLGGDELCLAVVVGAGACLRFGSAAATVAQPGPDGAPSTLRVRVHVAAGGRLEWLPEPTVVAAGAEHRVETHVRVDRGGVLRWREEVVLGRWGEPPGTVTSTLDVRYDGRPLLVQTGRWGAGAPEGWDGPAVLGDARTAGSLLLVGGAGGAGAEGGEPERRMRCFTGNIRSGWCAVLPLEGPGTLAQALAPDAVTLRRLLDGEHS